MISWHARFSAVALLLAGTALVLQARGGNQFVAPRVALASFPTQLQTWAGIDVPFTAEDAKSLGPGEFLQRTYLNKSASEADVDLYLAYLPNRPALYHHLPQDCLLGSGWLPVESGTVTLALPGDAPFSANRYLIARGDDRQLVLFWYAAHGRRVANETRMDFYLVLDSLRLNRTDNALIRMNTELRPGETPADAERRLLTFANLVNSVLKNYIPL